MSARCGELYPVAVRKTRIESGRGRRGRRGRIIRKMGRRFPMRRVLGAWLALVLLGGLTAAQSRTKTLDIYIVDTEGGKAALFVAPSGETVLVDSGNPGG